MLRRCVVAKLVSRKDLVHRSLRGRLITRVDLDGPSLCTFDPVRSNVDFDGPSIRLGEGAGLGIVAIEGLEPINA